MKKIYENGNWLDPLPKKICRVMKLTTLIILISIMHVSATVYSQATKLSLNMQETTIKEVLQKIESLSEFRFIYQNEQVDLNKRANVQFKDERVENILNELFKGEEIEYSITLNNLILIKSRSNPVHRNALNNEGIQQKTVSGKVIDEKGEPLPGVTVLIKGTTQGNVTDMDGDYTITNIPDGTVLRFSFVGMLTQEIEVGSQTNINVTMRVDAIGLDEVVAIGYGTQKKAALTSAIDVVDSERLSNRPVSSTSSLLQGVAPSLNISTPDGGNTPGANPKVTIRAEADLDPNTITSPLVVIDGVQSTMEDFNNLNADDIETINVMKDAASAAIYGAQAAHGVLMVTTKSGGLNEDITFKFSSNFGIVKPIRLPETADSYTFALAMNEARLNNGESVFYNAAGLEIIKGNIENPGSYTKEELVPAYADGSRWQGWNGSFENNNWIDLWIKDISLRQQYNLSAKGGGKRTAYYFSLGAVVQPGMLNFVDDFDNFRRYNLNANLSSQLSDKLKFTYHTRYSQSQFLEPEADQNLGRYGIYLFAYTGWATSPVTNPDGTYSDAGRVAQAKYGGQRETVVHNISQNLILDYKPVKNWLIHGDATYRIGFVDYERQRNVVYMGSPALGLQGARVSGTESWLYKEIELKEYWTIQGYTSYEKAINDHALKLMVGGQAEEANNKMLKGDRQGLLMNDLPSLSTAVGDSYMVSDELDTWGTAGFFGRFDYNYKNRYMLQANARYDGTGYFTEDLRWGFFPSISAGWNMSEEPFWEGIKDIINYSKLKVSYGSLGNQRSTGGYIHIPTMEVGAQTEWIFDGVRLPYVNTPEIVNKLRTWETITTLNFGSNINFMNNRLQTEFDYFVRDVTDLIGPADPVPSVLGTSPPEINNAGMQTKGFELQVSWRDRINKNLSYNASVQLSDARSKIIEYNTDPDNISINDWYVGKEVGEIWGFESDGFLSEGDFENYTGIQGQPKISQAQIYARWSPGDVKYNDLDGDGEITKGTQTLNDHGDLKLIGNTTPRYRYSWTFGLSYENDRVGKFDFSVFGEGVLKWDRMVAQNNNIYFWGSGEQWSGAASSVYTGHLDFYRGTDATPELLDHLGLNVDSKFPRPHYSREGIKNFENSTLYLESTAYMRIKNITLSYTVPDRIANALRINNLNLYFSGENLFVFTSLASYIDPEYTSNNRMYPQQAIYSFGLKFDF
jgi:TonB-linked SusC/RagA family outer membrane protein